MTERDRKQLQKLFKKYHAPVLLYALAEFTEITPAPANDPNLIAVLNREAATLREAATAIDGGLGL